MEDGAEGGGKTGRGISVFVVTMLPAPPVKPASFHVTMTSSTDRCFKELCIEGFELLFQNLNRRVNTLMS